MENIITITTISGFEVKTTVSKIVALYKNMDEKSYHVIIGTQPFKVNADEYARVENSFSPTPEVKTNDSVPVNETPTASPRKSQKPRRTIPVSRSGNGKDVQ